MRRRRLFVSRCHGCGLERLPDELFYGGHCPSCRAVHAQQKRANSGARLLAKARDGGTVTRDGQVYRVVVLPSSRRRRAA